MNKLFGTDGIRGIANEYPMTPELCVKIAKAAGKSIIQDKKNPKIIIAKDTRLSGYLIEAALTAGFISIGMEVTLVGPMPTPAVSMLVRSMRADMGVMISASHNPYNYNGIKFFDNLGVKISSDIEEKIEKNVFSDASDESDKVVYEIGKTYRLEDAHGRYIEFLKTTFDKNIRLDGLKIVIDSANGAAYKIAPTIIWELGAEVIPINVTPNGYNINEQCGAICPRNVATEVLKNGADLGIALDGDADRVIMCDENGQIIDGDKIIAILALDMKKNNKLNNNAIVVTEMANSALDKFMADNEINIYRTAVGDKFVYNKMLEVGANIGGETSGHIILDDYNKTGDGLIAALNVLSYIVRENKKLSSINEMYIPYPRVLKNVNVKDKSVLEDVKIKNLIKSLDDDFDNNGRIFVRASGTEPVIRILVEAKSEDLASTIANKIEEAILNKK